MSDFTRRTVLQGATAMTAAAALSGPALLDWAKAWAQAAPWKPEKARDGPTGAAAANSAGAAIAPTSFASS